MRLIKRFCGFHGKCIRFSCDDSRFDITVDGFKLILGNNLYVMFVLNSIQFRKTHNILKIYF